MASPIVMSSIAQKQQLPLKEDNTRKYESHYTLSYNLAHLNW